MEREKVGTGANPPPPPPKVKHSGHKDVPMVHGSQLKPGEGKPVRAESFNTRLLSAVITVMEEENVGAVILGDSNAGEDTIQPTEQASTVVENSTEGGAVQKEIIDSLASGEPQNASIAKESSIIDEKLVEKTNSIPPKQKDAVPDKDEILFESQSVARVDSDQRNQPHIYGENMHDVVIPPKLPPRRKGLNRSQTEPVLIKKTEDAPPPPPKPRGISKRMTTYLPKDFNIANYQTGKKAAGGLSLGPKTPNTSPIVLGKRSDTLPNMDNNGVSAPTKSPSTPFRGDEDVKDEHTNEIKKMLAEPRLKPPNYNSALFSGRRSHVALEIFTSEYAYVKSLNILVKGYIVPLRRIAEGGKSNSFITMDEIQAMFKFIENIFEFNLMLYQSMEERIKDWGPTQKLADVLLHVIPVFKLYSSYVSSYDNAIIVMTKCEKDQDFTNFVRFRKGRKEFQKYHLSDFLILPVQRIPRYKLLLQDFEKYTEEDHPDFQDIKLAHEKIAEVATFVNKALKEHKEKFKVLEVENRLYGQKGSILAPHRRYIKEGSMMKVCRKKPKRRLFFLFNDILLYGDLLPNGKISLHNSISLLNCTVEDISDTEGMKNAFRILSPGKSIVVFLPTAEEKAEWFKTADDAISEEKKKNRVDGEKSTDSAAPIWMRDSEAGECQLCQTSFSWKKRRHHCRNCGMLCCGKCSSHKMVLNQIGKEEVRVCDNCWAKLYLQKKDGDSS